MDFTAGEYRNLKHIDSLPFLYELISLNTNERINSKMIRDYYKYIKSTVNLMLLGIKHDGLNNEIKCLEYDIEMDITREFEIQINKTVSDYINCVKSTLIKNFRERGFSVCSQGNTLKLAWR